MSRREGGHRLISSDIGKGETDLIQENKSKGVGGTHSFRVVNKGVRLVVAETNIDQVLHPVLPLFLTHVTLEKETT